MAHHFNKHFHMSSNTGHSHNVSIVSMYNIKFQHQWKQKIGVQHAYNIYKFRRKSTGYMWYVMEVMAEINECTQLLKTRNCTWNSCLLKSVHIIADIFYVITFEHYYTTNYTKHILYTLSSIKNMKKSLCTLCIYIYNWHVCTCITRSCVHTGFVHTYKLYPWHSNHKQHFW